jgi:hypothetical protein
MMSARVALVVVLAAGAQAAAQSTMYGITGGGDLVLIDRATGAGSFIGPIGFGAANAGAADSQGRIFTHNSSSDQLILVDPVTGAGSVYLNLTGRPVGYGIRGMAFDAQDQLYVALSQASTSVIDPLATIDMTTGAYTVVGQTARTDIQGLAFSPSGELYASGAGGNLYLLNVVTAAATTIATGTLGGDGQALDFDGDGTFYATRNSLRTIDPVTGATIQVIGSTGFDIRGTAIVGLTPPCYANCDGSTTTPILNVEDFSCFINEFAAAQGLPPQQQLTHYANCDGSSTPPVLNVEDFTCFINAFAAGCR